MGLAGGEGVAVGGEGYRGGHILREGEHAVVLLGVGLAGDGAGYSRG